MCFTIHSTADAHGERDNENNWMEQFLSESPYPIFRIRNDGKLLYANRASGPLLGEWGFGGGDKLHENFHEFPLEIKKLIRKAVLESRFDTLEIEAGGQLYSLTLTPSTRAESVVISALDITSRRKTETELKVQEKQHEALFRLGELALSPISLQPLLDETVLLVSLTLGIEYCKIFKILPEGDFLLQAGAGRQVPFGKKISLHREAYSRAGCTLFSVKPGGVESMGPEIIAKGHFFGPDSFRKSGLVSGISVTIKCGDRPCGVITVHSKKKREFTKEDVYFLNSAAALISETIERRKGEQSLLNKVNFLETLLDAIPAPVFYKDREGLYLGCNELFARQILGLPRKEIPGHSLEELSEVIPEDLGDIYKQMDRKLLKEGGTQFYESKVMCADGQRRDFMFSKSTHGEVSGRPAGLVGVMQDITEHKAAEKALSKAEEIRKKEIHHRIKNNLQVVSSLLSLQSDKFDDEEVVEAFRESEQRVISMALIHEELYRSADVESIDFTAYLQKLTADLLSSYKVGNEEIRLLLDVENVSLGIDTAIPLGIIINELFSNSLKYAFPKGANGDIYIGLRRRTAEEYENSGEKEGFTLTFSDNGIGLPVKPDPGENGDEEEEEGSLGMKLINVLVSQLEGSIEIKRERGTKFIIRFKDID